MLWINYLDTGSERGDTSLEGSLRMEGWRGGAEEEEEQSVESWFHKPPFLFEERPKTCINAQSVRNGGRRVLYKEQIKLEKKVSF